MANDKNRDNKTPGLKGGKGVFGTPGVGYGGVLARKATSLAGGLGMQAYGNPKTGLNTRTPRDATMATRNYQYGEVMGKPAAPKPKPRPSVRKPTTINIPGDGLKTAKPVSAPAASNPKAMATNRFTGSTLGFTSGKTTGSTVTKSGVAGKTTAASRAATRAMDKGGVAGPTKNAAGKNASSMSGKRK